jgi:hypothetical protein
VIFVAEEELGLLRHRESQVDRSCIDLDFITLRSLFLGTVLASILIPAQPPNPFATSQFSVLILLLLSFLIQKDAAMRYDPILHCDLGIVPGDSFHAKNLKERSQDRNSKIVSSS